MLRKILAGAFLLYVGNVYAQTNYPGGIPGCIARYSFSADLAPGNVLVDVSGNTNSGITQHVTYTNGWRGAPNAAMKFDGNSSYALVPDAPNLSSEYMTMIALIRFDGYYQGNCQISMILSKGYPGFTSGVYGMSIGDNGYDNSCAVFTPSQQTKADFMGTAMTGTLPPTPPIQLNKWYFMATSYDGSTYASYVAEMDSANMLSAISPQFSVNYTGQIGSNFQNLTIGKHSDPSFPYWVNGTMDEVALFNRALTANEIYKIYYFLFNGHTLGINGQTTAMKQSVEAASHDGTLMLKSADGRAIGDIALYNLQGQILLSRHLDGNKESLDIASVPKQILYIKVGRNNAVETIKVSNL